MVSEASSESVDPLAVSPGCPTEGEHMGMTGDEASRILRLAREALRDIYRACSPGVDVFETETALNVAGARLMSVIELLEADPELEPTRSPAEIVEEVNGLLDELLWRTRVDVELVEIERKLGELS
jgi:hypothetical protein